MVGDSAWVGRDAQRGSYSDADKSCLAVTSLKPGRRFCPDSAVTIAAVAPQTRKLIRYTRGEINTLTRHGLEEASCECNSTGVDA